MSTNRFGDPSEESPADGALRLAFFLVDQFALMSYAAVIELFRTANQLSRHRPFRFAHYSHADLPAFSSCGAMVSPDKSIGQADRVDILFVISGLNSPEFKDIRAFKWMREIAASGSTVAGVAGGPLLLARAGLLNCCRCTIHPELSPTLQREFPDICAEEALYVVDGARITCSGGGAGSELAANLIESRCGRETMLAVREWHQLAPARSSETRQRLDVGTRFNVTSLPVIRALTHMEENIEEIVDRRRLSAVAGVSTRRLEQLFRTCLDETVSETYMHIRLSRAYRLLLNANANVTEAAIATGFAATEHFSRRFKKRFGVCPKSLKIGGRNRETTNLPLTRHAVD